MKISYRKAEPRDRKALIDICYHTGYMGESLEGRGIFNDRKLFGLIFCLYYLIFEPEHCFVACDQSDRAVGYIIGTPDTVAQKNKFFRHMNWRIALRLTLVTWWRYPGSLKELFRWLRRPELPAPEKLYEKYPAHLHTNLLPGCQGEGIGRRLMVLFLDHLTALGSPGVHLATSGRNEKAIPFYRAMGFELVSDRESHFWSSVDDYREIIFAIRTDKFENLTR